MEQLKAWVATHRALAIGGGIALVVLIYLWFRSVGTPAPAGDGSGGINAYYAAQAAAAGSAAETAQSTNALAASTNQTNTQGSVAMAQIQAALDAITQQSNMQAYHDYLGEQAIAGTAASTPDAAEFIGVGGHKFIQSVAQVQQGITDKVLDMTTGQVVTTYAAGIVGAPATVGHFDTTNNTFTPQGPAPSTLSYADFVKGLQPAAPAT